MFEPVVPSCLGARLLSCVVGSIGAVKVGDGSRCRRPSSGGLVLPQVALHQLIYHFCILKLTGVARKGTRLSRHESEIESTRLVYG